jgi:transposase
LTYTINCHFLTKKHFFNNNLSGLIRKKRFVEKLSKSETTTLEQGSKYGKSPDFRQRCQILLISNRGYEVRQIMDILNVNTKTVYAALRCWNEHGLAGLMRRKGQGRKSILRLNNPSHVKAVKNAVEKHNHNYSKALEEIKAELSIEQISEKSLSRFLKKMANDDLNSEEN